MSRAWFSLITILFVTLASGMARAEAPAGDRAAQALFEQGRDAMRNGAYADACPKFAESERIDPSNGTLLNLVLCEEQLGKFASAWLHAQQLVNRLPQGDPRKPIAEQRFQKLSSRVPKLSVRLAPTAGKECRILLDDVELAASHLNTPLPIDPGLHRVVVKAPEREDRTSELAIEEGRAYEFLAEPGDERAAKRAAPAQAPVVSTVTAPPARNAARADRGADRPSKVRRERASESPPKWLGWTAGGIGVAALAASAVMGAMVLDREAEVEGNCPEKTCKDASGLEAAEEGRQLLTGALIALGVGAAGVGVGIFVLTRNEPSVTSGANRSGTSAVVSYTTPF